MALQGTLTRAGFSIDPKCCAGVKHLSGAARQAWWLWEEPQRGQIMGKTHTSLSDLVEPWARSGWDEGLRWNGHWLRSLDVPRGAPKAWCTQSPLSPSVPQAEQTGSSGTHTTQLLHSLKLTWHFPITGRQLNKLCLEEGGKKRKEFFSSENSCSYNHWLDFSSFLFFPFFFFNSFVALRSDILHCSPVCEGSRNSAFLLLRHRPYTSGFVIKTLASPSLKWCEQGLL